MAFLEDELHHRLHNVEALPPQAQVYRFFVPAFPSAKGSNRFATLDRYLSLNWIRNSLLKESEATKHHLNITNSADSPCHVNNSHFTNHHRQFSVFPTAWNAHSATQQPCRSQTLAATAALQRVATLPLVKRRLRHLSLTSKYWTHCVNNYFPHVLQQSRQQRIYTVPKLVTASPSTALHWTKVSGLCKWFICDPQCRGVSTASGVKQWPYPT